MADTTTPDGIWGDLLRERHEIETHTTPRELALKVDRLENLDSLIEKGSFIGSLWAYGLDEGQRLTDARVLWIPTAWHVDSGRGSLLIQEWSAVNPDKPEKALGSHELERGRELLFGIFVTIVGDGLAQLMLEPASMI